MDNKQNTPKNQNRPGQNSDPKKIVPANRGPFTWLLIALIAVTFMMLWNKNAGTEEIDLYPTFWEHVENGHIKHVKLSQTRITGKFNAKGIEARDKRSGDVAGVSRTGERDHDYGGENQGESVGAKREGTAPRPVGCLLRLIPAPLSRCRSALRLRSRFAHRKTLDLGPT